MAPPLHKCNRGKKSHMKSNIRFSFVDAIEKSHHSVGIVLTSFPTSLASSHPLHQTAARPLPTTLCDL